MADRSITKFLASFIPSSEIPHESYDASSSTIVDANGATVVMFGFPLANSLLILCAFLSPTSVIPDRCDSILVAISSSSVSANGSTVVMCGLYDAFRMIKLRAFLMPASPKLHMEARRMRKLSANGSTVVMLVFSDTFKLLRFFASLSPASVIPQFNDASSTSSECANGLTVVIRSQPYATNFLRFRIPES